MPPTGSTRRRALLAGATLAAVLCATPATATAAANSAAGHVRVAIDSVASFQNPERTAARYGYVIVQSWRRAYARKLQRANPNVRVLAYKNLSAAINDSAGGHTSTGVPYWQAKRNPRWFLRNRRGKPIKFRDYPYLWAMDVGLRSYQRRWARNVRRSLRPGPWDGVYMDDVNPTMSWHYPVRAVRKYPSDAAWQRATESALREIVPRLRGAGLEVIANFGAWAAYKDVVDPWLRHVDGAQAEHFVKFSRSRTEGYFHPDYWLRQQSSLALAQASGKTFIGITNSATGDRRAALYGWASMLLAGDGDAYFSLRSHPHSRENWFDFYGYGLGSPLGPATVDGNGVHRRRFGNGLVLVNPTTSPKAVSFGGFYRGPGLVAGSGTTMQAQSGLVLLPVFGL